MIDSRASCDLVDTVKRQLATVGSFSSLTASCDGAFPARIADVLLHLSPKIAIASDRLSEVARSQPLRPFSDPRLPLPHPLDFEWRFSNVTNDELLCRLSATAGLRGKLLFVCTPAVALRAGVSRASWHHPMDCNHTTPKKMVSTLSGAPILA
jgi:hypothetical protein